MSTNVSGNKQAPGQPVHATASGSPKGTSIAGERFRDKVYLALVVAVLSFAGGAGGTLLAFRFEASKWQRETAFSVKKETLTKRMELLERTIKAVNRLQILDLYESTGRYSLIEGEDFIRSGKAATSSLSSVLDGAIEVKEAQSELSAVMTLDVLYFGPKTKRAVSDLNKAIESAQPWWRVDPAKTQALLDATAEELQLGLI